VGPVLPRVPRPSRYPQRVEEPELLRDERISEVFYFFEALTSLATGRTVGRKIGVMQEVLLRKYLSSSHELRRRLFLEQRLEGASGAHHKVEFSWFARTPAIALAPGDEVLGLSGVRIAAVDGPGERVRLELPDVGREWCRPGAPLRRGALHAHLEANRLAVRVIEVEEEHASLDVIDKSQLLASLESKRVGAQRFSASEKLGSGIQTIEKAKQASLVAIDLDLKHNGNVKPLEDSDTPKKLISLVALGNGVHWDEKDLAVLGTYVDFCFLVGDAAIIRYAEFVQELAGEAEFLPFLMDYFQGMTKQVPDEFEAKDDDFVVATPSTEARTIKEVLEEHLMRVNP
jgi:hypothetical protein